MLIEHEQRRSRHMSTNSQSGIEFYGDSVDRIINDKGRETDTVLGVLNAINTALTPIEGQPAPYINLETPDGIKSALAMLIPNQRKVNGVYDFLLGFLEEKTALFRNPADAKLKADVFIAIHNLQRKLENNIIGLEMLLSMKGASAFDATKEAYRAPRFPTMWKAISTAMAVAFLGGGVGAVAAADAGKVPDVAQTQMSADQSLAQVEGLTNAIDHNLIAAVDIIQTKLAEQGIAPANKGVDGGGRPTFPGDEGKAGSVTEKANNSNELSPSLQSPESFLPANFTLTDLPKGGYIGPQSRGLLDPAFTHVGEQYPGAEYKKYGNAYYELLLGDDAAYGSYGPDFDKQLANAKAYAQDLNTRSGQRLARVALYYAADQMTIAVKIVQEVNLVSTSNGQEVTTNMKPNSLVIHLDDGSQRLFPVAKEGDFIAPIAAIDLLNAEQSAGLIKPGQKTLALSDTVVVSIDELLDPLKRMVATIAQPDLKNTAKDMIVSVAPVGKPLDAAQQVPPTAVPTDVPTEAFPALTLTETPVDFKLEQLQYTNQKPMSPEELTAIGAVTGLETVLTDENGANHTFRISLIGMDGASDLKVTASINDALKAVGKDLKKMPANSITDIKIVMTKSGVEMKQKAEELGVKVNPSQTLTIGAGVPVFEYGFGKGPNGEDEIVIFASKRFVENGWSNNTDSVGKVIPFEIRFGQFISTSILTAFKVKDMPMSNAQVPMEKQEYFQVQKMNKANPQTDFDFLDITIPEPATK